MVFSGSLLGNSSQAGSLFSATGKQKQVKRFSRKARKESGRESGGIKESLNLLTKQPKVLDWQELGADAAQNSDQLMQPKTKDPRDWTVEGISCNPQLRRNGESGCGGERKNSTRNGI